MTDERPARKSRKPRRTIDVRDILGNAEVRKLAGKELGRRKPVTRHTLIDWRHNRSFPAPIRVLEQGELWDRREVLTWLQDYRTD